MSMPACGGAYARLWGDEVARTRIVVHHQPQPTRASWWDDNDYISDISSGHRDVHVEYSPSHHSEYSSEHSDHGSGDIEASSVVVSDDYYESDSYEPASPVSSNASGGSAYSMSDDYDDYDEDSGDYYSGSE
ncbi:uncharacterized protein B0H18DRAFT_950962 [Fomitopsis serialis]|uniref:uncharacterized protein n=1 Tax=Fomitopsis serialis TaxID=139415 RepID=UPI002008BE5E|nr:uncharacterized protein B0H18DRAFT_950962 [Neoantrodia serialis]KAH9935407.1 hypothetical protein B0H18DRAFT_950962 [Neoantrodia serialis]